MHKSESVVQNETHNVLWDLEIQKKSYKLGYMNWPQTNQRMKKENLPNSEYWRPGRPQSKIQETKRKINI